MTGLDPTLRNPESHRFNLAVEQSLGRETSVTVAYVGGRDRGLVRILEPNGSGAVPQNLRPDPRFSDQRLVANFYRSDYDSLQVQARRRFSKGIDFTVAYTFSRSRDDFSNDRVCSRIPSLINLGANPNAAGVQGGGAQFVERPRQADYGRSDFDAPHNLTFSHVIELPFGKGRRYLSGASGLPRLVDAMIGGWSLNGIAVLRSGERNISRGG